MSAIIAFDSPLHISGKKKNLDKSDTILAVVDIGGNSISLELRNAKKPHKKSSLLPPKYKDFCGLAQSISHNGTISPEARMCALETLKNIKNIIDDIVSSGKNVAVKVIGTAPFRDAENGAEFAKEIREKTGLPLKVISGKKEAKYAAQGVLSCFPDISGVVVDTGGGSTEFALIKNGKIKDTFSLPLGMLRISSAENPEDYIQEQLEKLPQSFKNQDALILTGGMNRALAKAYAKANDASLKDCTVDIDEYQAFTKKLNAQSALTLNEKFNIPENRAKQAPFAQMLLNQIKHETSAKQVVLTKATTRDGIRAQMIEKLRSSEVMFLMPSGMNAMQQYNQTPHICFA